MSRPCCPAVTPPGAAKYVVYTAHYDHLGISVPDESGDSIYNGFSDNAAGVAMLLAIAEALRDSPPAHSVAVPLLHRRGARPAGFVVLRRQRAVPLDGMPPSSTSTPARRPHRPCPGALPAATHRSARPRARSPRRHGWTATLGAASPNSDHWPFLHRGVPSIFIIPGDEWENTTPKSATPCANAGTATTTRRPLARRLPLRRPRPVRRDYALRVGLGRRSALDPRVSPAVVIRPRESSPTPPPAWLQNAPDASGRGSDESGRPVFCPLLPSRPPCA
jgi:hypothetical protein